MKRIKALLALSLVPLLRPTAAANADEHGIAVADKRVHVHDFHATLLHILGLDHEHLTYRHAGRDYRLTDVHGEVIHDLLT